jgi:hypothetical protein
MAQQSYAAGRFLFEVDKAVAFIKKITAPQMEADIQSHDHGPAEFQSKHVANIKWTPLKCSVGAGMGQSMYKWIQQSFEKNYVPKSGRIVSADFNYKAQSELEFDGAIITSVGFPKLAGDSKEAIYLDIEAQPTKVRWKKAGGESIKGDYGTKTKAWLAQNFRFSMGSLPCDGVYSVDAFTWKCSCTPDPLGAFKEAEQFPSKVTCPDIKVAVSMKDFDAWQQAATTWFIGGNHLANHEMQGAIDLLGPDLQKVVGRIDLVNCGFKKFGIDEKTANEEKIARFTAEFYVEHIKFTLNEVDA